MFELNDVEFKDWRRQFDTSNEDGMGLRFKPFAFTEEGVAHLSTVLNDERAIKVNIQIIRMIKGVQVHGGVVLQRFRTSFSSSIR